MKWEMKNAMAKRVIAKLKSVRNKYMPDTEEYDVITEAIAFIKICVIGVKPMKPLDESDLWHCGYCHHQIMRCTHQRYCEECGRKIEWEDM